MLLLVKVHPLFCRGHSLLHQHRCLAVAEPATTSTAARTAMAGAQSSSGPSSSCSASAPAKAEGRPLLVARCLCPGAWDDRHIAV